MKVKEAIEELKWIYQNGFGTDRILDSIRIAIEALEKQSEIVHCKDCKNWEIITIETIRGEIAHVGECELTGWLCGEQGYCMHGREAE